jgi:hypothetical protein
MARLLFVAATMVAGLTGCATTENYSAILQSWIGAHVDDLVLSWGPPQASFDLSTGGKVLQYEESRNVYVPGVSYSTPVTTYQPGLYGALIPSTTYVQQQTPGENHTYSCKTTFTADKNGVIYDWRWEGNDCTAYAPD